MVAHPFRIYGTTALAALQGLLHERVGAWLAEWFGDQLASTTLRNVQGTADPLLPAAAGAALTLGAQSDAFLVMLGAQSPGLGLLRGLLGSGEGVLIPADADASLSARLERGVAAHSLQALYQNLADTTAGVSRRDDAPGVSAVELRRIFRLGSGWAVLEISRHGCCLPVLLGPALLAALLPPRVTPRRGDLPRARSALAAQRLTLRADLGATTLTVGQVSGLAVGDVVKLDQRFDASVHLGIPGRQLAQGRVGMHDGHRAIRLAAT